MKSNTIIILIAFLTAFSILGLSEIIAKYRVKNQSIEFEKSNFNYLDSSSSASH
jgi:hypothetical protein